MRTPASILFVSLTFTGLTQSDAASELSQDLTKGDYLEVTSEGEVPETLTQSSGLWKYDKVYGDIAYKVGMHIKTGKPITLATNIRPAGSSDSPVIGAHGKGTEVRFVGKLSGDSNNGFPNLVLSNGAKFVISKESEIDLVMADSFYTRQLWAHGDGTGTIELEEGFVADKTQGGTVPNAFGTVRLNGVNLITHHSDSLPYNTRPDGRGGIYHNGHIVWEHQPGSVWTIKTRPQIYRAQLDFSTDGIIDCQAPLVHAGKRRVTSPKMVGGVFQSSGAFRTRKEGVTITKRGPAMLALEGQQGYYPDSTLKVEEGMLRMTTNPGNGDRFDPHSGSFLTLEVGQGAGALISAEHAQLEQVIVADGGWFETFDDTNLSTTEGIRIGKGANFIAKGTVEGDVRLAGRMTVTAGDLLKISGTLHTEGELEIQYNRKAFKDKPTEVALLSVDKMDGAFTNAKDGQAVSLGGGRVTGTVVISDKEVKLADLAYHRKKKK